MLENLNATRTLFASDYSVCRDSFIAAARCLPGEHSALRSWSPPEQPGLTCDAVYAGIRDAGAVLVIISGTHGVEGYCGSAIQRFLLQEMASAGQRSLVPPRDLAVVMVHSLNPWGMFWARRCDHQGIDINRNFIDFSTVPAPQDDYDAVLAFLSLSDGKARAQAMQQLVSTWGQRHFDQVFSGGQYHTDWAPFFGGHRASFSRQVIDEVIAYWSLAARQVVVLDLHTGLGPWAYGELISDHAAGSPANDFARRLFGPAVAVTAEGGSFSVPKQGLLDYRWHPLMNAAGCFLTLEFGTLGTESLFACLLDDHIYWRDHPPVALIEPSYQRQRAAMLRHFCPEDQLWQEAALFRAWQVVRRVFDYYA